MAQLSIVSSLEHQNGLVDRNPCFGDTLEHCPRQSPLSGRGNGCRSASVEAAFLTAIVTEGAKF
jgi:hypothetical protein